MPGVAREGDSISTGHGCTGVTVLTGPTGSSAKVFANNIPVECLGNPTVSHSFGGRNCSAFHVAAINAGSPTVFVGGIPLARITDSADAGSIISGSGNVFCGDSGLFAGAVDAPPAELNQKAVAQVKGTTDSYIANPYAYSNPRAAANGVKQSYAPVPAEVSTGTVTPSEAAGNEIVPFLTTILSEAGSGQWRETGQGGNPSNTNITRIWKELGFPTSNPWTTDQTAWCMGFLNWVLKRTGYRWAQEAGSRALKNKPERWNATEVPISEAQPGDLVLWNFGHVNFVYAVNNGKLTFCGGNQAPTSGTNNNPNDGDVTLSWPSGWTPSRGGIVGIWRPSKT